MSGKKDLLLDKSIEIDVDKLPEDMKQKLSTAVETEIMSQIVSEALEQYFLTACVEGNMSEQEYYVELRFPKRVILEILREQDREALWKLFEETLQNYMENMI